MDLEKRNTICKSWYMMLLDELFTKLNNMILHDSVDFDWFETIIDKYWFEQRLSSRIKTTIKNKIWLLKTKKLNLQIMMEEKDFLDSIFKKINIFDIDKTKIQVIVKHHILILKIPCEEIKKYFFQKDIWIKSIWFYVKNSNLWFDLLVVSDESMIWHEIKESITDLFLAENTNKISIFWLNNIDSNISDKQLYKWLLQEFFSHLYSSENSMEIEVNEYLSFVWVALQYFPKYKIVLNKVLNFLLVLLKTKFSEKQLKQICLLCISNPERLIDLLDNWKQIENNMIIELFENKFIDQRNIWIENTKQLFDFLSSCKLDVRFSKVLSRNCTDVYSTDHVETNTRITIELIDAKINIFENEFKEKSELYFAKLIEKWFVRSVYWDFEANSNITVYFQNWLCQNLRIDKKGNLYFELENTLIVDSHITNTYSVKAKQEYWEDTGTVIWIKYIWKSKLKSTKKRNEERVVVNERMSASISSIRDKISWMRLNKSSYIQVKTTLSDSTKMESWYDLVSTFIDINNPDSIYVLRHYVENLLKYGWVDKVVWTIGQDMKFIRQDWTIDELIIWQDWKVYFKINKLVQRDYKKTIQHYYLVHQKKYNIWKKEFVEEDPHFMETQYSLELLDTIDHIDQKDLKHKDQFIQWFQWIQENVVETQKQAIERICAESKQSIMEMVEEIRLSELHSLVSLDDCDIDESCENAKTITIAYSSGIDFCINSLNQDLLQENQNEDQFEKEKLMYKEVWREYKEYKTKLIEIIRYKRYYKVRWVDKLFEDYLIVKIEYDTATNNVKLNFDREWMCENHETYSDKLEYYLKQLWMNFESSWNQRIQDSLYFTHDTKNHDTPKNLYRK